MAERWSGISAKGKIKEVADYCETDVVGPYQVWLRYELFRGTLSQNVFEASQKSLHESQGKYDPAHVGRT
jgi:hypothetical protein